MHLSLRRAGTSLCAALAVLAMLCGAPCWAITAGHTDDFNDEDTHGWRIGQTGSSFPQIALDNGNGGAGDHSLYMATSGAGGDVPRLLVINDTFADDGNWEGDWTTAGILRVSMDVRNPNAFTLNMRIGIGGPGGVFGFGSGDTYVTDAIDVAQNPTGWQHIVFPVLAADFNPIGGVPEDLAAALADVTHIRILHNPIEDFIGASVAGKFYLDNIRAIGPPVLGDYNGNNVVDAADYVVWRNSPASLINEGASPDVVDQADYDFWRARFGATSGAGAGAGGVLGAAAVPEPASWLFMTGLFAFAWVLVRSRV